jgi:hypothetical protein
MKDLCEWNMTKLTTTLQFLAEEYFTEHYFNAEHHTAVVTSTKRLLSVPPVPVHKLWELRELISKARDEKPFGEDAPMLLQDMLLREKPIVTWVANVARREALDNYKATEDDIIWIERIAQ